MREYTKEDKARPGKTLSALYVRSKQDDAKQYIRTKFKGALDTTTGPNWPTTGIPIRRGSRTDETATTAPADRLGWTVGHKKLRDKANMEAEVLYENSHALGHGDYGSDNYLAAPPATKYQNTEQLAIEEGMREAAAADAEVRMKVTDVINAQTGQLEVRRYKVMTRPPTDGKGSWITVYDELLDG